MRVIITHNFTDDLGTLDGLVALGDPHTPHGIKDSPVDRLQAVPHIRDGTTDVDTEGILKICSMHNLFNIHGNITQWSIAHFCSFSTEVYNKPYYTYFIKII